MMPKSGRIRLARPSAAIINYKKWVYRLTLENFMHKDRRRNVGWLHYIAHFRVCGFFDYIIFIETKVEIRASKFDQKNEFVVPGHAPGALRLPSGPLALTIGCLRMEGGCSSSSLAQ
jgi:hypothetical protein